MFDINNFINSKIETHPWRHQIIDNFFDESDFVEIEQCCIELLKHHEGLAITGHDCLNIGQVHQIIGDNAFNIIMESNRKMLDNFDKIVNNFPNHRQFNKYFCIPTFHILPSNFGPQKIHDEAYDKTSSLVVYLYPKSSVGTALFTDNTQESFVSELEWKQNRAMLFCGEKNVTWHDFYSKKNPRVTLNYFIRELKSETLIETEDSFYFKDVDGPKTYLPKTLPEHILKLLTSGILVK
jgi:hypothetical protein